MRIAPESNVDERATLSQYLDFQRETVLLKTDGLNEAGLRATLAPSVLTLGGILYHLALVEESWLEVRWLGAARREPWTGVDWGADPDWEFHAAAALSGEELRARYRDACERGRRVVREAEGLDQLSSGTRRNGQSFTLRWVLLHLIEETARHAGHADLLRESIDGVVGE
jgi:hypothetical protein